MKRAKSIPILILMTAAAFGCGYFLGVRREHANGRLLHMLECQGLGDIHRATLKRIATDAEARGRFMTFITPLSSTIADIRSITFALNDYITKTNNPPEVLLREQMEFYRKQDWGR